MNKDKKMAKVLFKKKFKHTRESVIALNLVQYLSFNKKAILLQIGIGAIMILLGVFTTINMVVNVLLIVFGCALALGWREIPKMNAEKTLEDFKGELPETSFTFFEDSFTTKSGEFEKITPYSEIIRIVNDTKYNYLFISKESAFILSKNKELDEEKKFRSFICDKTQLNWIEIKSFGMFSITNLIKEKKNTKN